ncbi:MAG: hypothetical protein M3003_13030, partial [Candidatus Dormibacteraeota bacterium]|nr:hypothetical protein [Candidatus Dormibacteraeota bacterium]
ATWQDFCSTRNTQSQTFGSPGGPVTITGFCPDAQRQFDIQLSRSRDGGLTWTQATEEVNPSNGKDHYFPAIDVVSSGTQGEQDSARARANRATGEGDDGNGASDHVAVSYYRTDQVPNESTLADPFNPNRVVFAPGQPGVQQENSDYALSGGRGLLTPYAERVVSPRFPPPDGIQAGFNGDYSGLVVTGGESGNQNGEDQGGQAIAHPIWSDTRNAVPTQFNDPTPQGVNRDEDVFTTAVPVPDGHGEQTGD